MSGSRDFQEYAALVRRQFGNVNLHQLRILSAIAKEVSRLDTAYCNRLLTDAEMTRRENLVKRANKLAQSFGARGVVHNADPRGMPLFIVCPSGFYNDWGQRGIIVDFDRRD
jgi:hypothetical protein